MLELVYKMDSKSIAHLGLRVRIPLAPPNKLNETASTGVFNSIQLNYHLIFIKSCMGDVLMYICQFCGKEIKNKSGLTCHEKYYCNLSTYHHDIVTYTKHKKVKCSNCNKLIDVACIKKHEQACINGYKIDIDNHNAYHLDHDDLFCKFCGKECKNKNSLVQHEIRCRDNPNRKSYDSLATWSSINLKGKTKETSDVVRKQSEKVKKLYVEGILIRSNSGKGIGYKCGWYKDIWCDSSWELAFLIYNLEHGVDIKRNSDAFQYKDLSGIFHTYYPDFVIGDTYYEIKGKVTGITQLKIDAVCNSGHKIILITYSKIRKYLSYAKNKYGKMFYNLYDLDKPSWRNYNKFKEDK